MNTLVEQLAAFSKDLEETKTERKGEWISNFQSPNSQTWLFIYSIYCWQLLTNKFARYILVIICWLKNPSNPSTLRFKNVNKNRVLEENWLIHNCFDKHSSLTITAGPINCVCRYFFFFLNILIRMQPFVHIYC